jgi:hypothetical protein
MKFEPNAKPLLLKPAVIASVEPMTFAPVDFAVNTSINSKCFSGNCKTLNKSSASQLYFRGQTRTKHYSWQSTTLGINLQIKVQDKVAN